MVHSATQDYNLATSPTLMSIISLIAGKEQSTFKKILEITNRKKGSLSVLLGVLVDQDIITITPEKDRRKKIYSLNPIGIKKYFIQWLDKKAPQTKEMRHLLETEPAFDRHFSNFIAEAYSFDKLEDSFNAFIYLHSKYLEAINRSKLGKDTKEMSKANEVRIYLLQALTHWEKADIEDIENQMDEAVEVLNDIRKEKGL